MSAPGFAALKAGRYDEARRLFAEHEARGGSAAVTQMLLQKADRLLKAGDVRTAAAMFTDCLKRNPSRPDAYVGLARVALFIGDAAAAKLHAAAATRLAPSLGRGWTLLGMAHEAVNELPIGLVYPNKGATLGPSDFVCQLNLGRALAAGGRFVEGRLALLVATGLDPKSAEAFTYLGMAYRNEGQHANALRALERARDLSPKNAGSWATLADVHFSLKDYPAARAVLDGGLRACGEHAGLLEKAIACATLAGDITGAIAYVERELKIAPNHERAWLNLAGLTMLNRQFDASERAARQLLERNPLSWEAWFHLGNLYDVALREDEAEAAYRNALARAPGDVRPLTNLAAHLIQRASKPKHVEAVQLLEPLVARDPKDWRAAYNLALGYTRLGQQPRALDLARRIQREAPAKDTVVPHARRLEATLSECARPRLAAVA